jgi:hypothetical protein
MLDSYLKNKLTYIEYMIVTRTSSLTGEFHSKELDITEEQMQRFNQRIEPIQKTFPHLSAADREFILTGITDEEWESLNLSDDN